MQLHGVYCAPAPYDPFILTVAGVDLNHANIAGCLPEELGLLKDLALFHINSNRFSGVIPASFIHLKFLFELDVSNNRFSGPFPSVVFLLHSLKYLDVRFHSALPANLGNSPVSVLVAANNDIKGCIPPSLAAMAETLDEIVLSNMALTGCLRQDIGLLRGLTVLDVSSNNLAGPLPESIGAMKSLEQLNVAHNKFSGKVPSSICSLPKLENFTYSFNYFSGEPPACLRLPGNDDRRNCIPNRPFQRAQEECSNFYAHPISCSSIQCPIS
uniref:Leucine-rich repeat-containing N-terminal plant-type domain-containing protein n=1 Tax=Salix viminalis TaxID=40686 RepID=A0A6N2MV25_SALVM